MGMLKNPVLIQFALLPAVGMADVLFYAAVLTLGRILYLLPFLLVGLGYLAHNLFLLARAEAGGTPMALFMPVTWNTLRSLGPTAVLERDPEQGFRAAMGVVAFLLLAACLLFDANRFIEHSVLAHLDTRAADYLNRVFDKTSSAFAEERALDSAVSLLKSVEIQPEVLGISLGTIGIGEALAPIDDLVERYSFLLLLSTISLGFQRHLLVLLSWVSLSFLLPVGLLAVTAGTLGARRPVMRRLFRIGYSTVLAALAMRFMLPLALNLNASISGHLIDEQYEQAFASLYATQSEWERIAEADIVRAETSGRAASKETPATPEYKGEGGRWTFGKVLSIIDVEKKLERIKAQIPVTIKSILDLTILFSIEAILLPLFALWLLLAIMKTLVRVLARAWGKA